MEGVFATAPDGTTRFDPAPPPTDHDVARLLCDDPHPHSASLATAGRSSRRMAATMSRSIRSPSMPLCSPRLERRSQSVAGRRSVTARVRPCCARRPRARCPVGVDSRPTPRAPRTLRPSCRSRRPRRRPARPRNVSAATRCAHRSRKNGLASRRRPRRLVRLWSPVARRHAPPGSLPLMNSERLAAITRHARTSIS